MSIWSNIGDVLARVTTGAFTSVFEAIRTMLEGDPETRRRVAFSVAMIALSAKMAKADGIVTFDEVQAFQQIFHVPEGDQRNVARLFDLAKQDVAGFEAYAGQIVNLCGSGNPNCGSLEDILDGLFHIAKADGAIHQDELAFLETTATIFKLDDRRWEALLSRHTVGSEPDPYIVLGVDRNCNLGDARKAWRKLVQENHPDVLTGRGMPKEFVEIANERLKTINRAWTRLQDMLAPAHA